ncbi:MAG: bifunctional 5,10-methylenetetrahydrofolate dehydrogenase/5,10-methenyltetrahydrofolate cyclohydrolase [Candidatus Paceibacterota bacterium]
MLIDGKKIAEEIKEELKKEIMANPPAGGLKLAIVQVGENEISKKFVEKKVKFAEEIGVETELYNLPAEILTEELREKMVEICNDQKNNGVILQLPLPEHIDTQYVLDGIPVNKDIDVLSSNPPTGGKILPPLVGVVKIIFEKYDIKPVGKNIVVIGRGILVGKPIANWLIDQGATVSVLNSKTPNPSDYTLIADVIISGVGKPGLIKPDMVKNGVVIIDAGTSPSTGSGQPAKLIGDFDPAVAEIASLFTPVPGGVGPLTVAMLFQNLVELSK